MMRSPPAAWAGDCVPDAQKGLLGGLIALSPALGAWSGAIATAPGLVSIDGRLWLVAGLVLLAVAPVLIFGRPRPFPDLTAPPPLRAAGDVAARPKGPGVRLGFARRPIGSTHD